MIPRVLRSGMKINETALSKIDQLVETEKPDYDALISCVEAIVA